MSTQTRTIVVKVDSKDAGNVKKLHDQMKNLNKTMKDMSGFASGLRNAFLGLFGVFGVRELMRASDEFQLMRDRLKAFTGSAEEAEGLFKKLNSAAKITKTSVGAVGETFNRIAAATKDLGLSNDALLGITVALQQSFRASGSTISEATNATIQFAQGLASGQLRGQELRSVLEQNVIFGELLAKSLNVTRGELFKLAEAGKLTNATVLKVLSENFDEINRRANALGTTFEQSLVNATDAFRNKIKQLNDEFGLSSKFEKGINFAVRNMDSLFKIFFSLVASGVIIKLADQIITLGKAASAAMSTGGIGGLAKVMNVARIATMALFAILAYSTIELSTNYDIFTRKLKIWAGEIGNFWLEITTKVASGAQFFTKILGGPLDAFVRIGKAIDESRLAKGTAEVAKLREELAILEKNKASSDNSPDKLLRDMAKALDDLNKKGIKNVVAKTGPFAQLNQLFKDGKIGLLDYVNAQNQVRSNELAKKFNEGKISADAYYKALVKIPDALDTVRNKSQIGQGLQAGLTQYFESIDSLAGNISNAVVNTFGNLENTMFDFVKTGKFAFKDFAQAVVDDLTKIIIRMAIIRPLVGGLMGAMPGGAAAANGAAPATTAQAMGGVWQGGVQKFARGGVVNGPTTFGMKNGIGLMGEAGPEAIMPLTRGPDGKLGVAANGGGSNMNVIIHNNGNNQVETKESTGPNGERQIEVMIIEKVNNAIGAGRFDRTFKETYGMTRKGR